MLKRLLCDARLQLDIEVKGPVLIKAGDSGVIGPDMAFVRTFGYGGDVAYPYLPGTSLKGVLRSHVERIARTIRPQEGTVCLPYAEEGPGRSCGSRLKGARSRDESAQSGGLPSTAVYHGQCMACRMFGSLGFQGRVSIDDAYAADPSLIREELRDGVAIDRKTGGAAPRAKYDLRVVTRGSFRTTVTATNFEAWQLGALGLAIDDLVNERLRIGSGSSRGLGHVKAEVTRAEMRFPLGHGGRFAGIERLVGADERREYGLYGTDSLGPLLPPHDEEGVFLVHSLDGPTLRSVVKFARDEWISYLSAFRGLS